MGGGKAVAVLGLVVVLLLMVGVLAYFFVLPGQSAGKQAVAVEEGSLRDLVQEQVGDFELQEVEEIPQGAIEGGDRHNMVEALEARYVEPGGAELLHYLITTRSTQDADSFRQETKEGSTTFEEVVDERPVEASGRRVGTVTVGQGKIEIADFGTGAIWNNGNLLAYAEIGGERDVVEGFYESVPY